MISLGSAPRPRRGLFDATLALLLLYAVYAKTPCGALPVWAYRTMQGQPTPNLLATFRGRETSVDFGLGDVSAGLLASQAFPAPVDDAAKRTGVDPELLVSVLGAAGETCTASQCDVPAPAYLDQVLETYDGKERVSLLELAHGIATAARSFDGDLELALEALYVGPTQVERAVGQSRASGHEDPSDVEVHSAFYSPSVRRGQLQGALRVLAYHRLRTLAWPADSEHRISSPFGERIHPVLGTRRLHNGTDIAAPIGTPLVAAHRGRVVRRGRDSVSGKFLQIDHGFDIESTYCHMSEIDVEQEQRLGRRQPVGAVGATGRVTGPHLHYILRISGQAVDPELYGEAPRRRRARAGEAVLPELDAEEEPAPRKPPKPERAGKPKSTAKPKKPTREAPPRPADVDTGVPEPSASTTPGPETKTDETKTDAGTPGAGP